MNVDNNRTSLALVTGGGHRLGRIIALKLARLGYAVGLHYNRSEKEANRTKDEIVSIGVPVFIFSFDLTDPNQISELFKKVRKLPYPLHVMVNSAAVMHRCDLEQLKTDQWDLTMNLNLRAPWLCSKMAAKLMSTQDDAIIINISDSASGRIWTGFPVYSISKAALEVLTRLLARTFAPKIRVNAIAPGLVLSFDDMSEADWQRLIDRLPLKKQTSPESIAQAVEFLIKNADITGQILVIDGGFQLV